MKSQLFLATAVGFLITAASLSAQPTLKEAFKGQFLIGAAVNQRQFTGQDARGAAIVKAQFNSITPENVLKWEAVHPRPNEFNFEPADRYVEFGEKNGMTVIGHTLVWHSQTPRWVFQDAEGKDLDREALLARMSNHIHTVVGRYKGRIKGWDVVNEALNDNGSMRQTRWLKIIGDDYIVKGVRVRPRGGSECRALLQRLFAGERSQAHRLH